MSEILHGNNHVFENSPIKIEKKLCQNILRKEMLLHYKNCKTFSKGLHLKFNLSLCKKDRNLQRNCNFILRAAAVKIQDQIIKALNIEISQLQQNIRNLRKSIIKRISKKQFKSLNCKIKRITGKEREKIKQGQFRKYNRHNLVLKTCKKKNRRFTRKQFCAKLKEKRRIRKDKQKQIIVRIKETTPNQNAVNLTSTDLSESQKLLLRKQPSFVPSPSDINWYEVRRDFDKLVNQFRYRVKNSTKITSSQEIIIRDLVQKRVTKRIFPKNHLF